MVNEGSNVSNSGDKFLIYGAQAVGCVAGILGIALGIYNCITLSAACFAAGIVLAIFGFIIVVFEAPYCCLMFEFTDKIYNFSQRFSPLLKAVAYIVSAIIPLIVCITSISLWVACALMATCGILYGVKALRRSRETTAGTGETAGGANDTEMNSSRTSLVNKN